MKKSVELIYTSAGWSVKQAVEQAENSFKNQNIVGLINKGRERLGIKCGRHQRRMLIQAEIRREVAQGRAVKAVQVESQGNWTKWKIPERTLSWQELWTYEPLLLSSLLLYVYDYTSKPAVMGDD